MSSRSKHSLTNSWAVVSDENSATSSEGDGSQYESEEDQDTPRRRRQQQLPAATPRNSAPTTRRVQRSGRRTPARLSQHITPPRKTPQRYPTPEFIMPTPDSTPIPTRRQTRRTTATPKAAEPQRQPNTRQKQRRAPPPTSKTWDVVNALWPGLLWVGASLLDIFALVFAILKIPLAIALSLFLVRATIEASLPSIHLPNVLQHLPIIPSTCSIPLLRNFIPTCAVSEPMEHPSKGSLQKFSIVQNSFAKVLDMQERSIPVPMRMTHGVVMIQELRDLIQYQSKLPSKPEIIAEMESYVKQSRTLSEQFTDFQSHINRAVDKVISVNRYALRSLDDMRLQSTQSGALAQLMPFLFTNTITAGDVIAQYLEHARVVGEEADALLSEANFISLHLQNMEDSLELMSVSANRDIAGFNEKRDQLFASLWTQLGGNAKDRKHIKKNIEIAKQITSTTHEARLFLSNVQTELRAIKNDVEDLQARMNGPRNRASMNTVDIEEHIRYVTDAYQRLDGRRQDAKQRMDHALRRSMDHINRNFWGKPEHERWTAGNKETKELPAQ